MIFKNLLTLVGFLILCQTINAQINAVQYQIRYNEQTNLYDCYLLIKDGKTSKAKEKIQFNSQYTLIVPANSAVQLVKSYMPLQENLNGNGTKAQPWTISNITASPESDKNHDYISVVPSLAPTAYYQDLNTGDEIKLFSMNIQPVTNCGADVKLFENGISLGSNAKGFRGADYSNGFTIGGPDQIYAGNGEQYIPNLNVVKEAKVTETKFNNSIQLELDQNTKFGSFKFDWRGPNNFSAHTEDLDGKLYNLASGVYSVEITDARGCSQIKTVEATFKSSNINSEVSLVSDISNRTKVTESVAIYPNPANNFFNLAITGESGTKIAVDITDINGKVVQANAFNATLLDQEMEANIDVQNISPGIYNISVSLNNNITTHKLLIIR